MALEIIIWDVNHGTSISARAPNGNVLMLDCAANPNTGFSPICQTKRRWRRLDLLKISHPHIDHISDIVNIDCFKPAMFLAPYVSYERLRKGKYGRPKMIIEKYIGFLKKQRLVSLSKLGPSRWGGVTISWFKLKGYQSDINDYSSVTFLTYESCTFAYAGDLSSAGWNRLITQEGFKFTRMLRKTTFFVASHHGREEGFNPIIFGHMRNLKMVFISDKNVQPTSVADWYSKRCSGWDVTNESTGYTKRRKVVTTRNDGRIKIKISSGYYVYAMGKTLNW